MSYININYTDRHDLYILYNNNSDIISRINNINNHVIKLLKEREGTISIYTNDVSVYATSAGGKKRNVVAPTSKFTSTSGKGKSDKGSSRVPSISTDASKELPVVKSVCGFNPGKSSLFVELCDCTQPAEVLTFVEELENAGKVWQSLTESDNFEALNAHLFENVNNHPGECEVEVLGKGERQSGGTHSYAGGGQSPLGEKTWRWSITFR